MKLVLDLYILNGSRMMQCDIVNNEKYYFDVNKGISYIYF